MCKKVEKIRNPNFKFVRFGVLNHLAKQEKWIGNLSLNTNSYHRAPVSKGFYAMPYKYQELFLISSSVELQTGILPFKKFPEFPDGEKWDKMTEEERDKFSDDYSNIYKHNRKILFKNRRVFYKETGTIWHHLPVPRNEIIDESGSWVKTTMKTWEKAILKNKVQLGSNWDKGWSLSYSGFSKDCMEVFIDEKV